jgi:molybdopterin converting factor small subunit
MAKIEVPSVLRVFNRSKPTLEVAASSVRDALEALEQAAPGIGARVFNAKRELQRYVTVFVDGHDVRELDGLDTPLAPTATVSIVLAVAGG